LISLVNFIESAANLQDVNNVPINNLHPLIGKRKGQYAIDLGRKSGWRLIIIPEDEDGNRIENNNINVLYESTNIVLIWEVSNHYE
jgi:proteic killer suppression protein